MARQKNIRLRGTVDNIIYYRRNGTDCIRSKPMINRQTENTKATTSIFGMAIKTAALARLLLRPLLPDPKSRRMMRRLEKAFQNWMLQMPLENDAPVDDIPFFKGFSFNEENIPETYTNRQITVRRTIDNKLALQLPSFDPKKVIKAPPGTQQVVFQLMAIATNPANPAAGASGAASISISYTGGMVPRQDILLDLTTAKNNLTLVVMSIEYYRDNNNQERIESIRWKPAGI